ncbi:MAG: methionyl-tRNA formyltransferase [Vulcanimicrobiaceae bacterium]
MRATRARPRRRSRLFPNKLRAVFFGTSAFAVPALRATAAVCDCSLVVTQPDRPAGRGQRLRPAPVKVAALASGIPTIEPARLREAQAALAAEAADVFVVASYGQLVPPAILALPKALALNVHPSRLPCYRGATPLQSQLRDGLRESGVTIIAMDAGMDTGDVVIQARSPIGERETYGELHDRFAGLGAELLRRALAQLADGSLVRTPQSALGVSESEIARTATRPLTKDDLAIDPAWSPARVVDHVRAFSPSPAARVTIAVGGAPETFKVLRARIAEPTAAAGDAFLYRCGDGGVVAFERVVPAGRAAMSGAEFSRLLERRNVSAAKS